MTVAKKEVKFVWDRNAVLICYIAAITTITLFVIVAHLV